MSTWQLDGSEAGLVHGDPRAPGPRIEVLSTRSEQAANTLRSRRLASGGPPLSGEDLQRRYRELDADPGEPASLTIDGDLVECSAWRHGDTWWVAGTQERFGLIIQGQSTGLGAMALERIADIEPYLQAVRSWLRTIRSEA